MRERLPHLIFSLTLTSYLRPTYNCEKDNEVIALLDSSRAVLIYG